MKKKITDTYIWGQKTKGELPDGWDVGLLSLGLLTSCSVRVHGPQMCVSTHWTDPQSDVKATYVARGLFQSVDWQSEISKYHYYIRLALVLSSVGSLGTFQISKAPTLLLLDTHIYIYIFFKSRGDWRGSMDINISIRKIVEKVFHMFVNSLLLCCHNIPNIAIAALLNCGPFWIALSRDYESFI